MVELIGKISRGSKMDQIYLPKNRIGFDTGEFVIISPLNRQIEEKKEAKKTNLFFYGTEKLESIKTRVIAEVIEIIEKRAENENIIITGSFLDRGFGFKDIDILLISQKKVNSEIIKESIEKSVGIKAHIITLDNKTLSAGLSNDPLYSLMLSKCVSKNRIIYKVKRKIDYRLLDLNLLKSKTLIENYDILNGSEKYYLTMNMISILLFIKGKKLSKGLVNKEIEKIFNIKVSEIKDNLLNKKFLDKYKDVYGLVFGLILDSIKKENE